MGKGIERYRGDADEHQREAGERYEKGLRVLREP